MTRRPSDNGTGGAEAGNAAGCETAALWLFDELPYPNTTLIDAGPHAYDLRLIEGRLVDGRFGRALQVVPEMRFPVCYDTWSGMMVVRQMRNRDGGPSGLWGPTITPRRMVEAVSAGDWALDFWVKFVAVVEYPVTLFEFGYGLEAGFSVRFVENGARFDIVNPYQGCRLRCGTAPELVDQRWHHVAFQWDSGDRQFRHYVDGQAQSPATRDSTARVAPPDTAFPRSLAEADDPVFDDSKDYDRFRRRRFNLAIGKDRRGRGALHAVFDEVRLSAGVRYAADFPLPGSLSRNFGPDAPRAMASAGPPLLFASRRDDAPVELGARRHVFVDDALIDRGDRVKLTVNPPLRLDAVTYAGDCHGEVACVDYDNRVWLLEPDGYESTHGDARLFRSEDGLHFRPANGEGAGDDEAAPAHVVLRWTPMWGGLFVDTNPAVPPEERFKLTAAVANRGVCLYTSPDLVHWRRNETLMLPLISGGSAETFWDDQRGVYTTYLKRDGGFFCGECPMAGGRTAVQFDTAEIHKPWPFHPLVKPYFESWTPPCVTGEGPIAFPVDGRGDVYRTRAIKYPWAPDAYVAFPWRMSPGKVRQTEVAVSRDGVHWRTFPDQPMYLPTGIHVGEFTAVEAMVMGGGLIRRGDRLWHYAVLKSGGHDDQDARCLVRCTQRLDGFVSLDGDAEGGRLVTRPLVYAGRRLVLNIAAAGAARVALTDAGGTPHPGFGLDDCDVIRADSTAHEVRWRSGSDISAFSGTVVRLTIELRGAKLFALQFGDRAE